ncbi:hypothetical protein [Sphingomonas abietis]|uniref:Ribbon-helix-helix protein, CopG family n=1 Tax=Sphingomonas abietis TaxID=3012344 RepID=A0ABY7NV93_9SPHN|nr:hypothetical protein [Sphingomonas abietis]WBO24487.1 hypothetical protein PBT88_10480 [Sphingomonas abietis]
MEMLEIIPPAHTDASMGRPPLGMKPTTVRLPVETLKRIEALQGKQRQIALFIREAIDNELRRRENDKK